ncbi:MAG: TOBE domain-containing protein [Hyphomicrobiaceae bacterium]
MTRLDWRDRHLAAVHQPQWPIGTDVACLIPSSKIILHEPDAPPHGDTENLVTGTVVDHVVLGTTNISTIKLDGEEKRTLQIHVPTLLAERSRIGIGRRVSLTLTASAIHLMPAAQPRRRTQ